MAFVVFLGSASRFSFISGTEMAHGGQLRKIGGRQWNSIFLGRAWFRKARMCVKAPLYVVRLQGEWKRVEWTGMLGSCRMERRLMVSVR